MQVNDTITGGAGQDTFGFYTGFGADTITDFESSDKLDFTNIDGLSIKTIQSTASYSNGNTFLTIGTHGTILLEGVTENELSGFINAGRITLS